MNEFSVMLAICGAALLVALIGQVCFALVKRLLNNDWCWHKWGKWEDHTEAIVQRRHCKKCNIMEKRHP